MNLSLKMKLNQYRLFPSKESFVLSDRKFNCQASIIQQKFKLSLKDVYNSTLIGIVLLDL